MLACLLTPIHAPMPFFSISLLMVPASAQVVLFDLEGDQEVPPASTSNSGSCTGDLNALQTGFDVSCTNNVPGVTGGHIHNAPAGTNGPIVFFFDATTTFSAVVSESSLASQQSTHSGSITPISYENFLKELLSGNLYVNVHSTSWPGGEIRGQIPPPPSLFFSPQFGNGDGFSSDIVLINSASTGDPVTGEVLFYNPDGSQIDPFGFSIDPLQSTTLSADGQGPLVVGSAAVSSDGPLGGGDSV